MRKLIRCLAVCALLVSTVAFAQQRPERGQRGERDEQQRRLNREQFQQRMHERMKTQLDASDEEWEVIQPRFQALMEARQALLMQGRRIRRARDTAPVPEAVTALQEALEQDDAAAINEALDAYRAFQAAQQAEVQKAQENLREVLTLSQEARLVLMGILD